MEKGSGILELAAALSNPLGAGETPPLEPERAGEVVECLVENRVSLVALAKSNPSLAALEPFERALAEEKRLFSSSREEYGRIVERFRREGIETLLLKSCGLEPSFPYLTSNLDVLVAKQRGDDARKLLVELGYVELSNVEEPGKFLFRRFVPGSSYAFHLHEEIGWGVPFVDPGRVWEGSTRAPDDPELLIPGAGEALLVTLAHWFYEDKELTLGDLYSSAWCVRRVGGSLMELGDAAEARGWKDGFYSALWIADRSWEKLFGAGLLEPSIFERVRDMLGRERVLRSALLDRVRFGEAVPARIPFASNKIFYYRKILRDGARPLRTRLFDVLKTLLWAVRWKLHVRSQKPLLVAVSGCDGSGKSVQTQRLSAVLSACDIRHRVLWARGGSSGLAAALIGLARRILGGGDRGEGRGSEVSRVAFRRKRLANPLARFVYSWLFSLDLFGAYVLRAAWHLLLGNVVVCDRHVVDGIVDFRISTGCEGSPLALKLVERLAPRPGLHFLLDVDEGEALRRKPAEGGTGHIARARELFSRSAAKRGMAVIESGLDIDEAGARMIEPVLDRFYADYRTFLNRLLFSDPEQLNPGRWRRRRSAGE